MYVMERVKELFDYLRSLSLSPSSWIHLSSFFPIGENGNGKTTLVKLMTGELVPVSGEVKRYNNIRIALVNQHHAEQINLQMTPLEYMLSLYPGDASYDHTHKIRSHLSSCGVTASSSTSTSSSQDLQNIPVSALSGGQRSRVALAAVSFSRPHVLFLDEPTNNLDLESVEALAESVKAFQVRCSCAYQRPSHYV